MEFLLAAHDIILSGGDFRTGFEELAKRFPMVGHDGRNLTDVDVRRMFLAPKLVDMLNGYYQDRKRKDVDPEEVYKLLNRIISTIGLGNNATNVIMAAIKKSDLLHPSTEPVTWGSIIKDAMTGDVEETIETISFFSKRDKKNREWYDSTDMFQNSVHFSTSFGRS